MVGLSLRGLQAALHKIARSAGLEVEGRDARVHPRHPVIAPVAVRAMPSAIAPVVELSYAKDAAAFSSDYIENLSLGGAFIRTAEPHPEMTEVVLALTLPDGFRLEARATVVHVAANGMGVQFQLSDEVERLLEQALVRISAPKKRGLVVGRDACFVDDVAHELCQRGLAPVTAGSLGDGLRALADEATDVEIVVVRVDEPELAIERFVETVRFAGASDLAVVLVGAFDAQAWRDRSVEIATGAARDVVNAALAASERRRALA
jgi:Tfp pilus assembly protein PilZ